MTVDIIGGGKREEACREILSASGVISGAEHLLILPIPSARNGREVTGTDVTLDGLCSSVGSETAVACYGLPARYSAMLSEQGAEVLDVAEDERFTEENARLTAECTLAYIMSGSDRSLGEMKIGIVGYGRIGRALLEMLLFLGARVSVFTRGESTRLELLFSGVDAHLTAEADLSGLDLLVNTAPARVFSRSQTEGILCEVLELAPGNNLPYAKKITRLPSLPAKMLPKSSGRLYAEAIMRACEKRRM